MGLTNALNNRPIRVLGFITAYHSFAYGFGYLSSGGGFDGALVGLQINNLALTSFLGVGFLLCGAVLMFAFLRQNPNTIRVVSYIQSALWLFVALMYFFSGAYALSLAIGLTWSSLSGYIAFASRNRENIMAYDRTLRAQKDTREEDKPWTHS